MLGLVFLIHRRLAFVLLCSAHSIITIGPVVLLLLLSITFCIGSRQSFVEPSVRRLPSEEGVSSLHLRSTSRASTADTNDPYGSRQGANRGVHARGHNEVGESSAATSMHFDPENPNFAVDEHIDQRTQPPGPLTLAREQLQRSQKRPRSAWMSGAGQENDVQKVQS